MNRLDEGFSRWRKLPIPAALLHAYLISPFLDPKQQSLQEERWREKLKGKKNHCSESQFQSPFALFSYVVCCLCSLHDPVSARGRERRGEMELDKCKKKSSHTTHNSQAKRFPFSFFSLSLFSGWASSCGRVGSLCVVDIRPKHWMNEWKKKHIIFSVWNEISKQLDVWRIARSRHKRVLNIIFFE